jgi:OOP family OmpA-OmpF porin
MKKQAGRWGGAALLAAALATGAAAQDGEVEDAPAEEPIDEPVEVEGSGSANGNDRRSYISPMISYSRADDDRATDDALGGVLSVGRKMTSGLNLELTGFYQRMDAGGGAAELTGFGLGAMIFASRTFPKLYGILAVHHADTGTHPTTPASAGVSYDGTVFDTGIGYLLSLKDLTGVDLLLRAEARYRMDSHHEPVAGVGGKDEFYEAVFNLGVLVPLGALAAEAAPAEEAFEAGEPVAAVDSDGDGIADDADPCPDTPAGTTIDEQGCPAGSE